jgi:hypothetical protein
MAIYREVNYTIAMETEWKVAHGPKGYAFAIKRDDNSDVCVLHNGLTPQDKALATLISATPDLLEALQKIVEWYGRRNNGDGALFSAEYQPLEIQRAMQAIAKATGNA